MGDGCSLEDESGDTERWRENRKKEEKSEDIHQQKELRWSEKKRGG